MSLLFTARFHNTVAQLRQLPRGGAPEVAFIGRSNAGKSSAINAICQRRRLAFSSRTPGRTQQLNFFAIGHGERIDGFLVDMPGYGFAAAPGAVRQAWDALAGRYLRDRTELVGAVLMIDIRRQITDSDRHMIQWLPRGLPLVVLLTKCDKFGSAQRQAARRKVIEQLGELGVGESGEVLMFSSVALTGIDDARAAIAALLANPQAE